MMLALLFAVSLLAAISTFLWGMFTGACLVVALLFLLLAVFVRSIEAEFARDETEPLLSNNYPRFGP